MGDMGDNVLQSSQERKRNPEKCSDCRQSRLKCKPEQREWNELVQEKCSRCDSLGLACSPNYRRKSDPKAIPTGRGPAPLQDQAIDTASLPSQSIVSSLYKGHQQRDSRTSNNDRHLQGPEQSVASAPARTRRVQSQVPSIDGIKHEASQKLIEYNALVNALHSTSYQAPCLWQIQGQPGFQDRSAHAIDAIKEEAHQLFIQICELAFRSDRHGHDDAARWILTTLLLAMEKHIQLYDGRKRATILKMIHFFQRHEDHATEEHLLSKLADMWDKDLLFPDQNPCDSLARSLVITSESAAQVLARLWRKSFGDDEVQGGIAIPPLFRAASRSKESVTQALSKGRNIQEDQPGLFDSRGLHIAATLGVAGTVRVLASKCSPENIDSRDSYKRTALFLAAANGHYDCCETLLLHHASPLITDESDHTMLAAAAKGGHRKVVELLMEFKANINPPWTSFFRASTPLQAAVESPHLDPDLVRYMIGVGADALVARYDGKNAITLAEELQQPELAQYMRASCAAFQCPFDWSPSSGQNDFFGSEELVEGAALQI